MFFAEVQIAPNNQKIKTTRNIIIDTTLKTEKHEGHLMQDLTSCAPEVKQFVNY